MSKFTEQSIPDQSGKRVVITGATGGLGYETARMLAGAGAEVVLTGRNAAKGADAMARIKAIHPAARLSFEALDLGSLAAIADFSARMAEAGLPIDMLINNAGVMALPKRATTADGFEQQFGTNHLGHFALTGRMLPLLQLAGAPRVVSVGSGAAVPGKIVFEDLQAQKSYSAWGAYCQSKLANLLFMQELQRRSDLLGWGIVSTAAHPGFARTELIGNGPGGDTLQGRLMNWMAGFVAQSAADGALPTVMAALPSAPARGYFGPKGMAGMRGAPSQIALPKSAADPAIAERLWTVSEQLTGIVYPTGRMAA